MTAIDATRRFALDPADLLFDSGEPIAMGAAGKG